MGCAERVSFNCYSACPPHTPTPAPPAPLRSLLPLDVERLGLLVLEDPALLLHHHWLKVALQAGKGTQSHRGMNVRVEVALPAMAHKTIEG